MGCVGTVGLSAGTQLLTNTTGTLRPGTFAACSYWSLGTLTARVSAWNSCHFQVSTGAFLQVRRFILQRLPDTFNLRFWSPCAYTRTQRLRAYRDTEMLLRYLPRDSGITSRGYPTFSRKTRSILTAIWYRYKVRLSFCSARRDHAALFRYVRTTFCLIPGKRLRLGRVQVN